MIKQSHLSEQELARALLIDTRQGRLALGIAEHMRDNSIAEAELIATLLAALMTRDVFSAVEVARILVRSRNARSESLVPAAVACGDPAPSSAVQPSTPPQPDSEAQLSAPAQRTTVAACQ